MKNKPLLLSILAVAMALGTAWAVRGKFGHEQGAAWAGAIGALSLILVARRVDWYNKAFRILMAAAFGWGISGVMSYGVIVGYGRGTDFINVYYGLLMLFVLGVLYGFLGGGLFGLALIDSKNTRVKWHLLLAEMVALGLLTYAVLINQLGWFMTPPRSEMWAACFGASIALAWYIQRHQLSAVMKVAVWAALGAGFGFAFGNFLQVLGSASGLSFNFWNVMEYSIGFFGGAGMAYGTFTSSWPVSEEAVSPRGNIIPIIFVVLFIPFVVWDQSFVADRFDFIIAEGGSPALIFYFKLVAVIGIVLLFVFTVVKNYSPGQISHHEGLYQFFIFYTGLYILLSFLVTGIVSHPLEQYLYLLNLAAVLVLIVRSQGSFEVRVYKSKTWVTAAIISVSLIAILALIAMNSHDGMHGSQVRFK